MNALLPCGGVNLAATVTRLTKAMGLKRTGYYYFLIYSELLCLIHYHVVLVYYIVDMFKILKRKEKKMKPTSYH